MNQNYIFDDLRQSEIYDISIYSDIGSRKAQQDALYVASNDNVVFAVLCDGMGGFEKGEIASQTAVEAFTEYYQCYMQSDEMKDDGWMLSAVKAIDDIIFSMKSDNGKEINIGTTIVAIIIQNQKLSWVSVGDSRLYVLRGEEMVQITADHNYYFELNRKL